MRLKAKVYLGVDIGSREIRIIETTKNGICSKWAIETIPEGLLENDRIISEELLAKFIRRIMDLNRIKANRCSLCLPAHHIITRVISLPKMDAEILWENILFDIKDYLTKGLDDYIIDYRIMDVSDLNGVEVWNIMVVAILKEIAFPYIQMLKKAGLKPIYLDVPSNCLHKLLKMFSTHEKQLILDNGNLCLINIENYYSSIIILHNGNYFVDKTISFAFDTNLGQLIGEIVGVFRYFQNQVPEDNHLNNIILFGPKATSGNFIKDLSQEVGVDVSLYSEWISSVNLVAGGLKRNDLMVLGNAIGSTIRRL